jgi:hypothetical protein
MYKSLSVRVLTRNLLVVLGLALFVLYFVRHFLEMQKGIDFCHFYAAARMVLDGRGAQLYDFAVQDYYLARYTGRVSTYFNHPAFETLVYLPFSLWSLQTAYTLWCAFNALLLLVTARLLGQSLDLRFSWPVLLLISFLFVPLLLNFLQGQDSLLLLVLMSAAFVAAERKLDLVAGALLACGLIKFHLAIPAVIVLAATLSVRTLKAFAAVTLGLLVLSLEICGWPMMVRYPQFLHDLNHMPLAGMHSSGMANLRGCWSSVLPQSPHLALLLTIVSSVAMLGFAIHAAILAKSTGCERLVWVMAVLSATLVGYMLNPHDLTILLLPLALILDHLRSPAGTLSRSRGPMLLAAALLLLPPLHLLLLAGHLYVPIVLLILILYATTYGEIRRGSRVRAAWAPAASNR